MIALFLALAATMQPEDSGAWYGPITATFPMQFAGNPYDPEENDVDVRFSTKGGIQEDRIAYYDSSIGAWKAVLVGRTSGAYTAQLLRNGSPVPGKPKEKTLELKTPLAHGFLRVDSHNKNRFAWDDGTIEAPIGFDLGWQDPNILPITGQIEKMGRNGVNWTRIWACSWDGKNPWWPSDKTKLGARELWPPALEKWTSIMESAEKAKVGVQFVLFHHGEFSSQVDPNWPDNPWNAKNGGFLTKPGDFFTNDEAKKRAKLWLRYAVARFGASPSIFGWELFNEVQWVDPIHIDHNWDDVEKWHAEMADYVRSIDPYHHPVTSSSELRPGMNAALDYVQPHTYPTNVFASIIGTPMPSDKPGFFGEFGPSDMEHAPPRPAVRDGLFAGLLANHAGSGMYWAWDTVEKQNLYMEFALGRKAAEMSDWANHPGAKIAEIKVVTPKRSRYTFSQGVAGVRQRKLRSNFLLKELRWHSASFRAISKGRPTTI